MAAGSQRVAVVGGGITGLAAAHALCTGTGTGNGNGNGNGLGVQVTVFESDDRLGGKLRTSPFAGHPGIDEGLMRSWPAFPGAPRWPPPWVSPWSHRKPAEPRCGGMRCTRFPKGCCWACPPR